MFSRIPFFFILILGVSFLLHFILYISITHFFAVTQTGKRVILASAVFLLSLTFITSIIIVRSHENIFTGVYYALSAFWLGLLINLTLAFAIGWLINLSGKIIGSKPDMFLTGVVLLISAFLYSCYGVWNAFHPEIKNIEIEIKDLPEEWKGKTIVQLSDVHLGFINRAGFFRYVAEKANSAHPDIVVITGDLFDGMADGLEAFIEPLNSLEAKRGIFFVTGNHENYLGVERARSILSRTKIRVLDNEAVQMDGLQIIGVSYPKSGEQRDIRKIIQNRNFKQEMPGILLYHTPTNIDLKAVNISEQQKRTYFSPDEDFTAAKEFGTKLQLSGHTHKGQIFPFGYLTKRIYHGLDYGLNRFGDFALYTTCGTGTWGPPMRTGNTPEIVAIRLNR